MTISNIHSNKFIERKTFLQGTGVGLGLPLLESMSPAFAKQREQVKAKCFVAVCLNFGLHNPYLVPKEKGRGYKSSKYLKPLQDIRNDFSVISGTSHPWVSGGHTVAGSTLTSCPLSKSVTTTQSVSVDQYMAKHLGGETRFPSLALDAGRGKSLSYTDTGVQIPPIADPVELFSNLFLDGSSKQKEHQIKLIERGYSVMDVISGESKRLQRELHSNDRHKMDQWLTSIRDLEKRFAAKKKWIHLPKPMVNVEKPVGVDQRNVVEYQKSMLDLIELALKTDSTRFVTLSTSSGEVNNIPGVKESYHPLSHHGNSKEKLQQLAIIEQGLINNWAKFLRNLKGHDQNGRTLLDETMVLLTSHLGNASTHSNKNMPVLFAGGGFKHGNHLAFDQKNNLPFANLFVSALQQLGLPETQFGTGKSTMQGLV